MQLRLFHKLFAAFVVASFASIILFAGIAHWYMGKSFLRYINEERVQVLEAIASEAGEQFSERGDWEWLAANRRAWRRMLLDGARERGGDKSTPPGPPHRRKPPHRMPTLYDLERNIVVGREPFGEHMTMRPIVSGGETVGWVGLPPLRKPTSRRDINFARRQADMLAVGAGVALILSIAVASLTARRLSRPIDRIGDAARELATGKFATRLPDMGRDEIGKLAGDFNVLARTLEENESARRRWIADTSHELRTPLANMRGEIEAVRDGIRDLSAETIDSLDEETAQLTRLVEDLYQLAQADVGALDYMFEPCSLGALLTESVNRFVPRFEAAGLDYNYGIDAGLSILADRRRLLQLVDNLLENCCRYVDSPGRIDIELRREQSQAVLEIHDSGPGYAAGDPNILFEPLERAERSRAREFGGSGLGLAICRRIVTAHDGEISAFSSNRGGLGIRVRLPIPS